MSIQRAPHAADKKLRKRCRSISGLSFSKQYRISVFGIIMRDYHHTDAQDKLSKRLNYSKSYICRIVKRKSGDTFSGLINRLRVKDACQLIRSTDRPIAEIAFECGFASVEYFNRVFRNICGVSPRKFKRTGKITRRIEDE